MVKKKVNEVTVARGISPSKRTSISSSSAKIEAANLMEEVAEILEPCIQCGMCKSLCPVFKALKEERVSARGKAIILSDKVMDKVVFECALCRGCEQKCPLNIKVSDAVLKVREAMVLTGRGLKSDEKMVQNVWKYGSPFGKMEDENFFKSKHKFQNTIL